MTELAPVNDGAPIRPRERDAILQALRAGVVPRTGLQHIAVGRTGEIAEMLKDLDRIASGAGTFRVVTGDYGSGKTFFLTLVRLAAHQKRLVVMGADLTPDRRLFATDGKARALFSELSRSTSTRTKPDGEALRSVVERFAGEVREQASAAGKSLKSVLQARLEPLTEMVSGYDFTAVLAIYIEAFDAGDEAKSEAALRWLRGEWATRTDARTALGGGVRTIIDDATLYDALKLFARFFRIAGYAGLLVTLDELVNLYKLNNSKARQSNYEQILRILNDVLQGGVEGLGVILGGTPEFLLDTRRGLYSYEALRSRLEENSFARGGLIDLSGPVLRLGALTPEDVMVLLQRVRRVIGGEAPQAIELPDQALEAFLGHCEKRVGEAYFRTPRETIRAFINFAAVLEQNPGAVWSDLVETVEVQPDRGAANDTAPSDDDDELTELRL